MITRRTVLTLALAAAHLHAALPPGTWWIFAQPAAYAETAQNLGYTDGSYVNKGKILVSPSSGKPTAVTFTFVNECWQLKDYDRSRFSAVQTVAVSVNASGYLAATNGTVSSSNSREYPPSNGFKRAVYLTTVVNTTGAGTRKVSMVATFIKVVQLQYLHTDGTWRVSQSTTSTLTASATAEAQIDPQ